MAQYTYMYMYIHICILGRFIYEKILDSENSFNFLNALHQYKLKLENTFCPYIAPSLRTGPPTFKFYTDFSSLGIKSVTF